MFFEVIALIACAGAAYQAHQGTNSQSAKIAMQSLIAMTAVFVIL